MYDSKPPTDTMATIYQQYVESLNLPRLEGPPQLLPLPPDTEKAWINCFEQLNLYVESLIRGNGKKPFNSEHLKSVPREIIHDSFAMLQGERELKPSLFKLTVFGLDKSHTSILDAFWKGPELTVYHLVRFLLMEGAMEDPPNDTYNLSYSYCFDYFVTLFFNSHKGVGLRELGAAFIAEGIPSALLAKSTLGDPRTDRPSFGLEASQQWPFWAEHLETLSLAIEPASGDYLERWRKRSQIPNAYRALDTFPVPPEPMIPQLWNNAVGPKTLRPAAQKSLENLPGKVERLLEELGGGTPESRLAAAEWLVRLNTTSAIAPLKKALQKEKSEATKGGLMNALEQLGASVDEFLDRKGLLEQASKGLSKGVPKELAWFSFENLPVVHWAGNSKKVDPEIVKWWLVQGFKLKSAEPGVLLRKYCSSLKASEREALGKYVLEAWLAQDGASISREEAETKAHAHAQKVIQLSKTPHWPQGMPLLTFEDYYNSCLGDFLKEFKGSAVATKGILCVAAVCAGGDVVPAIKQYLGFWYGFRVAQCRALIQVLAWIEHKSATQLLLAISTRFRTRTIQEEARKQVEALSARKGWSIMELADRTIPGAGLDDSGLLTLDFGTRQFTANLNSNLEFQLHDSDGKSIKSLPEPRIEDDQEKSIAAKKLFSSSKKELKTVITNSRQLFYEAMCTQRSWGIDDWKSYLNCHPIVRHLCPRLIWIAEKENSEPKLFRPLEDGTFSDENDNSVELESDVRIRVAHECQTTRGQSKAWQQHIKDYGVEPLFEQFGKTGFIMDEAKAKLTSLVEFEGFVLNSFKLRSRATKLGYLRGQTQDGAWFYDYHKHFPALKLDAVIEFTGNTLPEESRDVALKSLSFHGAGMGNQFYNPKQSLALNEVPTVLITECWHDLRQLAADGTGFDPKWETNIRQ